MGIHPPKNGLSLCAGSGGLDLGLMLAEPDFHTRCFVEFDPDARDTLIAAQRNGTFAPAPIWGDVKTFDGRALRGAIDTILAGYPCQPFSMAGKRLGADDPRHLWPDIARIIRKVHPEWVFLENVAGHISLGSETVLRELRDMGWTPAAGLFSAAEVGAPHERQRWFCVAHNMFDGAGARAQSCAQSATVAAGRWEFSELGDSDVDDRQDGAGRLHAGSRHEGGGTPDAGRSSGEMVHPQGLGRGEGRPEPVVWRGRDSSSGADDELADAGSAGLQGRERPGSHNQRDGAAAPRSTAERGGFPLFPPGPGARDEWAAVLAASADRAPASARRDVAAAAIRVAAILTPEQAQAVESRESSVEGIDGLCALVSEAGGMVGQVEAVASFRQLAHGLAQRTRALRRVGNGVVPLAAAHAWRALAASHGLGAVDLAPTGNDDSAG